MKNIILITSIFALLLLNGCGDRAEKLIPDDSVDKDNDGFLLSKIADFNNEDPDDTDPCVPSLDAKTCDRDKDGLINEKEIILKTDPKKADTDGDGLSDGIGELLATPKSDPLNACDPNPNVGACDQDKDGLTNDQEIAIKTDPKNPDTDGDGLSDGTGEHLATPKTDPLDPCDPNKNSDSCDQDKDGLTNAQEITLGTIPTDPDTDGDGVKDGADKNATNSTALKSCLPIQLAGYRGYDYKKNMWQIEDCDGDTYKNGQEDDFNLGVNHYLSDPYDPLDACFMFNGKKLCLVIGEDNRTWIDRNLGADQKCTSSIDTKCYGYLYQWGRGSDGHQLRASSTSDVNPTSITFGNTFEISTSGNFDWLSGASSDEFSSGSISTRRTNWSSITSSNTVCPVGFYIPTKTDLTILNNAARITVSAKAFASKLKFPVAGAKLADNGSFSQVGKKGYVWSTSDNNATTAVAFTYSKTPSVNPWTYGARARGHSLRCIKKQ